MDRRRFMQFAGFSGLAVMAPLLARDSRAGIGKYSGPFWIMINAGGGWDPTMLCDPKGGTDPEDHAQVNHSYTPDQKGTAGAISYAPTSYEQNGVTLMSNAKFFGDYHDRLTILNGVDTSTNNHDGGSRNTWSGRMAEGFPCFAALAAGLAAQSATIPLAFLSNGGYDATEGVVSLTRVGGTGALQRLAFTNEMDPGDADTGRYHTPTTAGRIAAAQEARLKAAHQKQRLPAVASAMNALYLARQADDGLAALGETLKSLKIVNFPEDFPELEGIGGIGEAESMIRQAQMALVSFKAGVAVSANISMGGYDSHDNSDDRQSRQMMILLFTMHYIYQQLDVLGLKDQVYVVVGSDFGRTPYYNDNNWGKDHWNITSMMVSGPKIPGDRVIGSTDGGYKPIGVNPKTLAPDSNGTIVEPRHLHQALRKIGGITGTELDKQFGLAGDPLPLFG